MTDISMVYKTMRRYFTVFILSNKVERYKYKISIRSGFRACLPCYSFYCCFVQFREAKLLPIQRELIYLKTPKPSPYFANGLFGVLLLKDGGNCYGRGWKRLTI